MFPVSFQLSARLFQEPLPDAPLYDGCIQTQKHNWLRKKIINVSRFQPLANDSSLNWNSNSVSNQINIHARKRSELSVKSINLTFYATKSNVILGLSRNMGNEGHPFAVHMTRTWYDMIQHQMQVSRAVSGQAEEHKGKNMVKIKVFQSLLYIIHAYESLY